MAFVCNTKLLANSTLQPKAQICKNQLKAASYLKMRPSLGLRRDKVIMGAKNNDYQNKDIKNDVKMMGVESGADNDSLIKISDRNILGAFKFDDFSQKFLKSMQNPLDTPYENLMKQFRQIPLF